jgi:hypothetical protein
MPKNYLDLSRSCIIAIETFIRGTGKLSEATKEDLYLKAYTQKMLFDMHIKKTEFYRDILGLVELMKLLEIDLEDDNNNNPLLVLILI